MHIGPQDLQDTHHQQHHQQPIHHHNNLHAQQQQHQQQHHQHPQHLQQQQQQLHHNLNMPGHSNSSSSQQQQQLDLDAQHMLPQSMDSDYNGLGEYLYIYYIFLRYYAGLANTLTCGKAWQVRFSLHLVNLFVLKLFLQVWQTRSCPLWT